MNILIISPHHDDEVIGCGGTIINHYKNGDTIFVVYITAGWSGIPEIKLKQKAIKIRENESRIVAKILGVKKIFFLREDDRNIYNRKSKIIEKLIKVIREIKPHIIYAPHPREKDIEHKIVYEITKEAVWLSKSPYFPRFGDATRSMQMIYLYEVWTPLEDFFKKEDITNVINTKIKALLAYKSQLKYFNLVDAIIGLNLYRGSMVSGNKKFAEVFSIEKS
jgi:LmbE family N-acetylglucosaminyl deacetylase